MNALDELARRLVERRESRIGALSPGAHEELERAVRKDPASFVDGSDDEAFYRLAKALRRHELARDGEDLLDDDEFFESRSRRLSQLVADCQDALSIDADCLDAALVAILAADDEPTATLEALLALRDHHAASRPAGEDAGDAWDDLRRRGHLRLDAALALACLESGHYRMAIDVCRGLMAADPADHLGARRTCSLAYARLEEEDALEDLDQRFGRRDDAWSHLAHTILHYRLDRPAAAGRALAGFARLVDGGAYALLRPTVVDVYLPDRPNAARASYGEANLAVWEAEPVIASMPDFVGWAADQPDVVAIAQAFADRYDLDW